MRADHESDWPSRLLRAIADTPLVGTVPKRSWWATHPKLTPTELRVLECVSRGLTTRMAGEACRMGEATVKSHHAAARYRLRAKNTTHACCEALRRGLIS